MTGGGTIAVVPVRGLSGGKTRLSGEFTPEARMALTRRMLRGVLRAALTSRAVGAVVVVSPDPDALAVAMNEGPGIVPVAQDPATPGLNAAIELGRDWAVAHRASTMLVLFGDLPLLSDGDVRNLVRRDAPVVLAPDRHGTGTNALLLRLGGQSAHDETRFRFQFGPNSYARHVDEAHRLGLEAATAIMSGTALDLDTPDDWRTLVGDGSWVIGHRARGMGDG